MLRRKVLSLVTVLMSVFTSGLAIAQDATTPPPAAPPAAEPAPATPAPAEVVVGDQPAAATPAGDEERTEEIVVTGTRIRRKDLTTPAPVTVISRDQISASGKVNIGDFLQALPEQGNAINTQFNNGGDGSTGVALRSLGSQRTLVLMNGRRIVPSGTGANDYVDLNSIPSQAIERVEILKDGASAVYGSDAIGGVINLITRKGFDTSSISTFAGTTSAGGGTTYDVAVTAGTSSERGSLLFSAGYLNQDPVSAGDRDWAFNAIDWDYEAGEQFTNGSSTIPAGRLNVPRTGANACTTAFCQQLFAAFPEYTGDNFMVDRSTALGFRPYSGAVDSYNFQPENLISTPMQRIQLFTIGDMKLAGDAARGYFEASYVNRESNQQIAPNPLATINSGISVSPESIYNPFGVGLSSVGRRLVELDQRMYRQNVDTFRLVGGVDGALPQSLGPAAGWFWDVSLNYGRTNSIDTREGELRANLIQDAIGPSVDPDGSLATTGPNGDELCVTSRAAYAAAVALPETDPTRAAAIDNAVKDRCVPLNLLGGPGTITQDQISALGFTGTNRGWNQQLSVQANTSGELFQLLADRPVSLAAGYEWRELSGAFIANPISEAGEGDGNNFLSTRGSYTVNEVYGELSIPVVSNLPFAQDVEATVAARYFDYSTFGDDITYKLGARWRVIPDVTVRGTYSTAFRAPSIPELFEGAADSFESASDPCNGLNAAGVFTPIDPNSALGVACATRGQGASTAALNNQDTRDQIITTQGGNPNLDPETADIFTLGLVLEPRWVKNLSVTVDYYNISLDDYITTIGTQTILDSCFGASGTFCDQIVRRPDGFIDFVDDRNVNVGGIDTSGIDLAFRYGLPTAFGRLGFAFDGTWLAQFDQLQPDGRLVDSVGNYDLALALPEYRFNAGVTWGLKGFGAGVSTRFIGSFEECANEFGSGTSGLCYEENERAAADGRAPFKRTVDAWASTDVFVSYALKHRGGRTSLALGANNVFDANPRIVYAAGSSVASSDPSTYDYIGRFVYARLEHAF